jgi:hypothetical protein
VLATLALAMLRLSLPHPVRWLLAATLLVSIGAAPALAAETRPTIEMRVTPPFVRPYRAPTLCMMLAFPVAPQWWLGAGYEFVQDYDAVLWTAKDTGHKPVVMSGIHAGGWYRGGAERQGLTWAAGGLVTFANSTFSLASSPDEIDAHTYVIDVGGDFSFGKVRDGFRFEVFATPAWSFGRIASTAIDESEGLSQFTYRFGVALAVLIGS